jgi:hypothetical protein
MQLSKKELSVYDIINFYKRYENLSKQYNDLADRIETYSIDEVLKILNGYGYKAKFIKRVS